MDKVAIIIGGSSGIGKATAKIFADNYKVVIAGRNVDKLNKAVIELYDQGADVIPIKCDVTDIDSVTTLAEEAATLGPIEVVVNCAGVSPSIDDYKLIININAVGVINVTNILQEHIISGGVLINLSSMSADMIPSRLTPHKVFELSTKDVEQFKLKFDHRVKLIPANMRLGFTYGLSKQFVRWYSNHKSIEFAESGLRILTVSPGLIDTPMGRSEYEAGKQFIEQSAIKRMGKPEEIGQLIYNIADPRLTYLTATDILVDGGAVANRE